MMCICEDKGFFLCCIKCILFHKVFFWSFNFQMCFESTVLSLYFWFLNDDVWFRYLSLNVLEANWIYRLCLIQTGNLFTLLVAKKSCKRSAAISQYTWFSGLCRNKEGNWLYFTFLKHKKYIISILFYFLWFYVCSCKSDM